MSASIPDAGWLERLRSAESRVSRLEGRVERIEDADQQDVIVERLAGLTAQLDELRREVRLLRGVLVTLAALMPVLLGAVAAVVGQIG